VAVRHEGRIGRERRSTSTPDFCRAVAT
jgi:hypothetical protein